MSVVREGGIRLVRDNFVSAALTLATGLLAACSGGGLPGGVPGPAADGGGDGDGGGGGGGQSLGLLVVSPAEDFIATGVEGGPFAPKRKIYVISNPGDFPFDWSASVSESWVTVLGATSGRLDPAQSTFVAVDLTSVADTMPAGQYAGTIAFVNATNGNGDTTLSAELGISPSGGGATPGLLVVDPIEDLVASGPQGGPFSPPTKTYSLSNAGGLPLGWSLDLAGSWLTTSGALSGTLAPGESYDVVVDIGGTSTSLAPGSYVGSVDFTNATDGAGNTSLNAQLDVIARGRLAVAPVEDFLSAGPQGGPFTPSTKSYSLSNVGGLPLDWSLSLSESWLTTSGAVSGTLAPGAAVDVVVDIAAAAASLAVGSYSGTIEFANSTDGGGNTSVDARLDVIAGGHLAVSPAEDFQSFGFPGGPFQPPSKTYSLTNVGGQSIGWSLGLSQSWLATSSSTSGVLAPGASTDVVVEIGGNATSLPSGSYAGTISFTNTTDGSGNTVLDAELEVLETGQLSVTPVEDFDSSGPQGGPFTPSTKTYALSNVGGSAINWTLGLSQSWLTTTGATSGTLTPGASVDVVVQIAASAASLPVNTHQATIGFTNTTNGNGDTTVGAQLDVLAQGALTVAPIEDYLAGGPEGGPFTPSTKTYTLSNTGGWPIVWSVSLAANWLTSSGATSGTLVPGASVDVVLEIGSSANSLPAGSYAGSIDFANTTNGNGDASVGAGLDILDVGELTVSPAEDFLSTGPVGGPFTPPDKSYLLSNTGGQTLAWSAAVSGSWLSIASATSGTLDAGQSTSVVVALSAAADSLPSGAHAGTIYFTNTTDGNGNTSQDATLSITANGWTDLSSSPDSRLVYVSSSQGNDANDGLSEQTPKATINAGYSLLRNGFPDWLQLRQGDSFNQFSGLSMSKSGRSPSEPLVITSYGSLNERPKVYTNGATNGLSFGNDSNIVVAHIAFEPTDGVADFRPNGTNPVGAFLFENCHDILIEGCLFKNYAIAIQCFPLSSGASNSNIAIRRNVVDSTYSLTSGGTQGILVQHTNGILIEENFLDHCAWNEIDPRAAAPNGLGHAVYMQSNNSGCVLRGNVISWPASAAAQCRSGGIIEDNFTVKAALGIRIGGSGASNPVSQWVQGTMSRNVILDGYDNQEANHVYAGVWVQNADGVTVSENIFANTPPSPTGQARAISISPQNTFGNRDISVERNIVYDWGDRAVALLSHGSTDATGWRFIENDFQDPGAPGLDLLYATTTVESSAIVESRNNEYWSTSVQSEWFRVATSNYSLAQYNSLVGDTTSVANTVAYPDPTRDVGDYMSSISAGATLQDFIDEMILQSQHNWRELYTANALNDFIRAGFGMQ